jgi:ATP-dependent Zn protease
MLVAGSVAVQRILGISKVSGHTRDFQEATNAIVTMIREDGYHQVLSVYLAGTGSSHLVPEDSIEKLRFTPAYVSHGASDIKTDVFLRETKFDQELVGMAFFRAQKEAAEMVDANKAAILEAAEILGTDMFLDGNTLQEIFLRHNLVKAEMVVKPRKADNSISGD